MEVQNITKESNLGQAPGAQESLGLTGAVKQDQDGSTGERAYREGFKPEAQLLVVIDLKQAVEINLKQYQFGCFLRVTEHCRQYWLQ